MTQDAPWYLVHSKPRNEALALQNLLAQGYEAWLPTLKRVATGRRKPKDGSAFVFEPLFPRYVFFRPGHAGQSIAPARSTLGVSKLVTFGTTPATLAHAKVQEIAQWMEQQHLQDVTQVLGIKSGTKVGITDGPLAGLDALVTLADQDRVVVLLNLLGKAHQVELPAKSVMVL